MFKKFGDAHTISKIISPGDIDPKAVGKKLKEVKQRFAEAMNIDENTAPVPDLDKDTELKDDTKDIKTDTDKK